jgi:predicted PurR-regulated permease PerM
VQGVTGLVAALPTYFAQAKEFLAQYNQTDGLFASLDLETVLQEALGYVKNHLTAENIVSYLSSIVSITSSFLSVLITFIISVYMLAGRESLLKTMRRLAEAFLPEKAVALTAHYSKKTADIFSRYMYSMLLDALCIFILMIPGLYISGIPYPLAFAVFIAVANLIPYFGAIVSGSLTVLVLLLSGHWGMAVFLGIYVLVLQQVDGNILQPRIYGQSVGIKPIYVLLAITVGGGIAGFVGMLIGVPVMAVLQMLVNDLIGHRNRIKRERAAALAAGAAEEDDE